MLKVKVITIGKCKERWLEEALAEYQKRLAPLLELTWVIARNDEQFASLLQEPFIALDPNGEQLDSIAFSRKLHHFFAVKGSRLTFAIGGAEGFPSSALKNAYWKMSLSPLTFTHQIARLVFAEQLYRALEIAKGSPYHK